ncbi:hypothetical protein [Kutzneria kofuensis]|uniref:Uncharacterized protein n=1 Tax=Kutzneria kofuensis TaxID=103725 RepID=A0A7W9KEK8_9PSEU|nr:hypothetical protein [Kutzneria kofuensis]MBB5891012.1 hypothetical protein [Kutzneria kofuensis]
MNTVKRESRVLDRMLTKLRAHLRANHLPRPIGITMSTLSRTVQLSFGTGEERARLHRAVAWGRSLHGVHVTWLVLPNRHLVVTIAGQLADGTGVIVSAGADIACLGGVLVATENTAYVLGYRLPVGTVRPTTLVDVDALTGDLAAVSRFRGAAGMVAGVAA